MSLFERLLLLVALVEIPLQLDAYFFYQEADAVFGAIAGVNVSLTTFAVAGLYLCWLLRGAAQPHMEPPSWHGNLWLVAYLGIAALSSIVARDPALSMFEMTMLVQAFALFFYLANRLTSREDAVFAAGGIAASLAIQAVLVIATRYVFGERSLGPLKLVVGDDGRPGGTMVSPVVAGSVLALLTTPVAALAFCPTKRSLRIAGALVGALGALAVVVTQTRGAIMSLGFSAGVTSLGLWSRGWLPRSAPWAAAGVLALAAIPLLQVVQDRVAEGDGGSAVARVHLAKIASNAIEDSPLFGHGLGNCHHAIMQYADGGEFRGEWFYTVHCKYLLVWVETGVLGLVAFLAFLLSVVRSGWRTWFDGDRTLATLSLACAAAIAGQMIHMAVDVFNSRIQVQTLWVVAGVATGLAAQAQAVAAASPRSTLAWHRKRPQLGGFADVR